MFSPNTPAMYVASVILFLLPWSLLLWACSAAKGSRAALPVWRGRLFQAALLTAAVATVLHMAWNGSWLRSGGSPHGMGAGPGLWQDLGPFLVWSFLGATALAFFGRGKARFLMLAWTASMWAVFQFIYFLQFD